MELSVCDGVVSSHWSQTWKSLSSFFSFFCSAEAAGMATAVGMAGVATYKIASCFAAGVCETQVYKTGRFTLIGFRTFSAVTRGL
jgi:hypothetical protein